MLVHMSVIYADNISHCVLSICFWQIKILVEFWCALRLFIIQRNCIKFCEKNEIKCARTFKMLTVAFGESTMSRTQVQLWYDRFKEGREYANVNKMSKQWKIEAVKKIISDNHYLRDCWWCWRIVRLKPSNFTDVLGIKRAAAKIVPKLLNFDQNQRRLDSLRRCWHDMLKKVITGDK